MEEVTCPHPPLTVFHLVMFATEEGNPPDFNRPIEMRVKLSFVAVLQVLSAA